MIRLRLIIPIALLSIVACNLPSALPANGPTASTEAATTSSTQPPAQAGTSTPSAPPQHRIGVRVVDGTGEFYDTLTGAKFVPRGMNYARLGPQQAPDGSTQVYHSTFDPDKYDPARAQAALEKMHADGYNVVRVFISQNTIGTLNDGLLKAYVQNIADFLVKAKANDVYVMVTQDWLPGGRYGAEINKDCCTRFNFNNAQNLPSGAVRAYQQYYRDLIGDLLSLGAPTDAVFSYELRNEFFYDRDYPPFNLDSGTVTVASGKTYDMSSPAGKQKMAEEGLPYFIDQVRASILEVDPTALVSIGFFQPQTPNPTRPGDERLVVSAPAIWNSQADFIDLHAYPDAGLTLPQYVENFGINGMKVKPIIMGEFGASTSSIGSASAAARKFVSWQAESCAYGFDGWLFWTWDTTESPDFFNALQGNGEIEKALSPVQRPDPCTQ